MQGFKIRKVAVVGPGNKKAEVEFCDGVNLIIGPSNTGKSLILDCIDYCFGYVYKKNSKKLDRSQKIVKLRDKGYSTVCVTIELDEAELVISREIGNDKEVYIESHSDVISSGRYTLGTAKSALNYALPSLIGIEGEHRVHAAKKLSSANRVTWRSILNMFYVNQNDVSTDTPILYSRDAQNPQTYSKALFLYLINETNYDSYQKRETLEMIEARNEGVVEYLSAELGRLSDRREELEEKLQLGDYSDDFIEKLQKNIKDIQREIDESTEKSKDLMNQIYKMNSQLSAGSTIHNQFQALQSQYDSDIKRMAFVVDAKKAVSDYKPKNVCPLCGSQLHSEEDHQDYAQAILTELSEMRVKIQDLASADKDIREKNAVIEEKVKNLEEEKSKVDKHINNELIPQVNSLQKQMERYRAYVETKHELILLAEEEERCATVISEKQTEEKPKEGTYEVNEDYTSDILGKFNKYIGDVMKGLNFPRYDSAHFDLDTFDVLFGKDNKLSTMGGGFCGIINTAVILAAMHFLVDCGKHPFGVSVVDSPLTQLSESEYKEEADTIKYGFIQYLFHNDLGGQAIFAEHKDRMPQSLIRALDNNEPTPENVNIIEFTKSMEHGRFGFIPELVET